MIKVAILFSLLFGSPERIYSFTTFSMSATRSCSIAKANQESFKICMTGNASRPDFNRSTDWALEATLAWFRVFSTIDAEFSPNIEFSCESPALTIILKNGSGRSYAQAGRTWIYNEVPYGTWTHELGHALVGLGDTYTGGRAGRCRSGQPESLMCWGGYGPRSDKREFSTLWQDDIDGATFQYRRLFGVTLPRYVPNSFNIFASFDIGLPYPDDTAPVITMSGTEVMIDEDGPLTPINPEAEFE